MTFSWGHGFQLPVQLVQRPCLTHSPYLVTKPPWNLGPVGHLLVSVPQTPQGLCTLIPLRSPPRPCPGTTCSNLSLTRVHFHLPRRQKFSFYFALRNAFLMSITLLHRPSRLFLPPSSLLSPSPVPFQPPEDRWPGGFLGLGAQCRPGHLAGCPLLPPSAVECLSCTTVSPMCSQTTVHCGPPPNSGFTWEVNGHLGDGCGGNNSLGSGRDCYPEDSQGKSQNAPGSGAEPPL